MGKLTDLTGMKFGRWTVLCRAENIGVKTAWLCKCDCKNETIRPVMTGSLTRGKSKSCGCINIEITAERVRTHGMTDSRIYAIFHGMHQRCYNSNDNKYIHYGGRGVKVCDEWTYFENFYEWAMSNGYQEHLTLDRKDVNGNYEPSNCRWATMQEQQNNKRVNLYVTINNITKTAREWDRELGYPLGTISRRTSSGENGEELLIPLNKIVAEKQSGISGITWNKKAKRWDVRIQRKYIGRAIELNEAIEIKNKYELKTNIKNKREYKND